MLKKFFFLIQHLLGFISISFIVHFNINSKRQRFDFLTRKKIKNFFRVEGCTKTGKLNLADLAGSEKVYWIYQSRKPLSFFVFVFLLKVGKTEAKGMRLDEAKKINQSLSALGLCNLFTFFRKIFLTKKLFSQTGINKLTTSGTFLLFQLFNFFSNWRLIKGGAAHVPYRDSRLTFVLFFFFS